MKGRGRREIGKGTSVRQTFSVPTLSWACHVKAAFTVGLKEARSVLIETSRYIVTGKLLVAVNEGRLPLTQTKRLGYRVEHRER